MNRLLSALALTAVLAACGSPASAPAPAPGTGVQGTVTIGPTCPVERVNSPCPPRPIKATIDVRDAAGKQVSQFVSGSDGRFQIDLLPGTYTLMGAGHGAAVLPRPIPVTVTVVAGSYTTVNVQFDSGIR